MDPINPWIDPTETRRMAERLRRPAREPIATPEEAGFDESFVGFSDAAPAENPADEPVAEQEPKPEPAAEPVHPAVASCPRYEWLREHFRAIGHFIFDHQGGLVCDDGGYGRFHFIARDLVSTDAPNHNVRVRIGAREVLEIIPVEIHGGTSWLCVIVPEPLAPEGVRNIHQQWLADGDD